jgi:aminoglycoside phosphotransferase (APT) family kinase protein
VVTVNELLESGEPRSDMRTLVHGDFFSANLLPGSDGLSIIDWEMLALGDPMWDLGFLIGADRGLPSREVDRVIATYGSQRPVDRPVLLWHKKCWDAYWGLKDLARQMRSFEISHSPTGRKNNHEQEH